MDNLLAAIWQDGKGFGYATLDINSVVFLVNRLTVKPWRLNYSALIRQNCFLCEDFAEMALIEGRRGLRRRPLWEFEIDTARQQLNLQFGNARFDWFWRGNAPRGLCAAGCHCSTLGYATYRPAPYSFHHHGASAGQHHHGCRHAPQP